MTFQKKGYTSGEIAVAWIMDWDNLTRQKAKGQYRLLIVDGHSSHFTVGFLEYARNNKIEVLCYPSHSTHVYQGLDVVIFSSLKRAWSDERDKFERTGPAVSKMNLLEFMQEHTHVPSQKKTFWQPFGKQESSLSIPTLSRML